MSANSGDPAPMDRLLEIFGRNGYARLPSEKRRQEGPARYKKGWEVRLVVSTEVELREVRRLLHDAGIRTGKPFKKAKQLVQPIYGEEAVKTFTSGAAATGAGQ